MNHHAPDASVANEKIGTAPDCKERQVFIAAKANEVSESMLALRLDPELRGAANAQCRMLRQRLVKAYSTILAYDGFQLFRNDKIGGEDLQLFVDVASAETQNKIAGLQQISHVTMHPLQAGLIAYAAMSVLDDFIDNCAASNS